MVYFQTKNPNLGKFMRALHRLENVDIFCGHWEYFTDIWGILWPFGTFSVHLVYFFQFWQHEQRTIWQPLLFGVGVLTRILRIVCVTGHVTGHVSLLIQAGLPDFSWYKIPKREKYTKLPRTMPKVSKI
jgi:hypothetical protein